jgi:uncharacterized protein YjdB
VIASAAGVQVTISPTSASVATGTTQQFTATVANSTDTGVMWTSTGGTISSSGLYTAGTTQGTFTVTATSVQDTTKSASSTVTVSSPQAVSVSIAPTSATIPKGTTQQFTATVANASNPGGHLDRDGRHYLVNRAVQGRQHQRNLHGEGD